MRELHLPAVCSRVKGYFLQFLLLWGAHNKIKEELMLICRVPSAILTLVKGSWNQIVLDIIMMPHPSFVQI
jgi:hypothetical protein